MTAYKSSKTAIKSRWVARSVPSEGEATANAAKVKGAEIGGSKSRWVARSVQSEGEATAKAEEAKSKMMVVEGGGSKIKEEVPKQRAVEDYPWRKAKQQAKENILPEVKPIHPWRKAKKDQGTILPLPCIELQTGLSELKDTNAIACEFEAQSAKLNDEDQETALASGSSNKGEEETGSSQEDGPTDIESTPRSHDEVERDFTSEDEAKYDLKFGSVDSERGSESNTAADFDPEDKDVSSDVDSTEVSKAKLASPPGTWMVTPCATPQSSTATPPTTPPTTPPATPPATQVEPAGDQAMETDQSQVQAKQPLVLSTGAPLFKPGAFVADVGAPTGCRWLQGPTAGAMKPQFCNPQFRGRKNTMDMLDMLRCTAQHAYPCQSWNLCVAAAASPISGVTEAELILRVPPAAPDAMVTTATMALHEALAAQSPCVEVQDYDAESAWISFSYLKDPNKCCWQFLTQGYCPRKQMCSWPHIEHTVYIVRVKLSKNEDEVSIPEFATREQPVLPQPVAQNCGFSETSWNWYGCQPDVPMMQGMLWSGYGNYVDMQTGPAGPAVEGYQNVDDSDCQVVSH